MNAHNTENNNNIIMADITATTTTQEKKDNSHENEEEDKGKQLFINSLIKALVNGKGKEVYETIVDYSVEHGLTYESVLQNTVLDSSQRSIVHYACHSLPNDDDSHEGKRLDILERLLSRNEKIAPTTMVDIVGQKDADGLTPLMIVCQRIHSNTFQRIKFIMDIDPSSVTAKSHTTGATALHYAAGAGASRDILELLVSYQKDPDSILNTFTLQGSTPLHWATSDPPPADYSKTIQALIDLGADVNACSADKEGKDEGGNGVGIPVLIGALASGNDIHAKILVENGADLGILMSGNVTVLHMAAELNLHLTLSAMISAVSRMSQMEDDSTTSVGAIKAYLNVKNDKGQTPLDVAAVSGNFKCFQQLLLCQEDTNFEDTADAKSIMLKIQEKWNVAGKASEDEEGNHQSESKEEEVEGEAQAKAQVASLLSNPPRVSDEAKMMALEFKAKGNEYFRKGEWNDAIIAYTDAITLNPTDETFYSNRSAAYLQMNKYHEALHDAVLCRYLNPKWVKGCYRLANARLALGKYEDAAVSAWEGLKIEEGNPELESLITKCIKMGKKQYMQEKNLKDNRC